MSAGDSELLRAEKPKPRWCPPVLRVLLFVLVGGLFTEHRAFGLYPLPPEIERLSSERQKAYVERSSIDSYRERTRLARQRHEQREQTKEALVSSIRREARARQRAILREMSPPRPPPGTGLFEQQGSLLWALGGVTVLAIVGGLGALALGRNSGVSWLDRTSASGPRLVTLGELRAIARQMREEGTPVDLNPLADSANGDPELMKRIVDLYLCQIADRIAQIKAAIDAGSPVEVKGQARDCIGASSLCGMTHIAPLFNVLGQVSPDSHLTDLLVVLDRIEGEFDRIKGHMSQSPAPGVSCLAASETAPLDPSLNLEEDPVPAAEPALNHG